MADVLWLLLAVFLIAGGGAVLGGLVMAEARRAGVELADAFDGYDEDDVDATVVLPVVADPPWYGHRYHHRHGGQHTARDSRCRVPRYVLEPWDLYPTAEYPHLEAAS